VWEGEGHGVEGVRKERSLGSQVCGRKEARGKGTRKERGAQVRVVRLERGSGLAPPNR